MIVADHLQISNIARLLTEDPDLIEGRKGNWRAGLIDILKAYVKPGKGWKEYIKNPQKMPGQMFEQKSFNHYIRLISQNTSTELR